MFMKKLLAQIFPYIAIVILLMLLSRKQEPEVRVVIRENTRKIDSLENQIDLLVIHYRNISDAYRKTNKELTDLQKRYNELRKNKTPILADSAYDSILNVLYPR